MNSNFYHNQQYQWRTVGKAGGFTATIIHFFASAVSSSAPYEVTTKISITGEGLDRAINLDGIRLLQPDGVKLEDLFSELNSYQGFYRIFISLEPKGHKLDLSTSEIFTEVVNQNGRHLFRAINVTEFDEVSFLHIKGAFSEDDSPEFVLNFKNQIGL